MLLAHLVEFLASLFCVEVYPPQEQGGLYGCTDPVLAEQPLQRVGLALQPWPGLADWVATHRIDALWLHRPWQLDLTTIPGYLPILYHHLPFDEQVTIGHNRWLARALGFGEENEMIKLGAKQAPFLPPRPLGMIGWGPTCTVEDWCQHIAGLFGGYESVLRGTGHETNCLAVVGAMTDGLVREAADQGVGLYLTGQYRMAAQKALTETGISLIAVGHQRSEQWGLRLLAELLEAQKLEVAVWVE